ncbi:MAG: hypothetical protein ACLGSA_05485 [Acidobacteriota bacterium]
MQTKRAVVVFLIAPRKYRLRSGVYAASRGQERLPGFERRLKEQRVENESRLKRMYWSAGATAIAAATLIDM